MAGRITLEQWHDGIETGKTIKSAVTKSIGMLGTPELEGRQVKFVFSSEVVDRVKDVVFIDGIDITSYKENPVILFNHDTSKPIGYCVKGSIKKINGQLIGTIELVERDFPNTGEHADMAWQFLQKGVLGCSIGFIPRKWKSNALGGYDLEEIDLTEISVVATPCNPEALPIEVAGDDKEVESVTKSVESVQETPVIDKQANALEWIERHARIMSIVYNDRN